MSSSRKCSPNQYRYLVLLLIIVPSIIAIVHTFKGTMSKTVKPGSVSRVESVEGISVTARQPAAHTANKLPKDSLEEPQEATTPGPTTLAPTQEPTPVPEPPQPTLSEKDAWRLAHREVAAEGVDDDAPDLEVSAHTAVAGKGVSGKGRKGSRKDATIRRKNPIHRVTQPPYEDMDEIDKMFRIMKQDCPWALTEMEVQDPPETGERNRILIAMPRISPALTNEDGTPKYVGDGIGAFVAPPPTTEAPAARLLPKLKIPKILMMTSKGDSVPRYIYRNMMRTKNMNPDYEFHHHSDNSAREFIARHMSAKVLEAFDMIIPGAFKADLFRYCFLYVMGGVYVDADQLHILPIADVLKPEDEFVSAEDNGNNYVYNAFIAVIPRHPIIVEALDTTIERILGVQYGRDVLDITGPQMFGDVWKKMTGGKPVPGSVSPTVRLLRHTRREFYRCSIGDILNDGDNRTVMWSRFMEYKSDVRWMQRQANYWDLWNHRQVYHNPHQLLTSGCQDKVSLASNAELARTPALLSFSEMLPFRAAQKTLPANIKHEWRIPLNIIQMHKTLHLPSGLAHAIRRVADWNPEFSHNYFTHKSARQFIIDHCEASTDPSAPTTSHAHFLNESISEDPIRFNGLLTAFDSVTVSAYKSDLFRYCYLYVKGGVWVDADFWTVSTLREVARGVDLLSPGVPFGRKDPIIDPLMYPPVAAEFELSISNEEAMTGFSLIGLLGTVAQHPVVRDTLIEAIININSRYYGRSPYHITGHALFSRVKNAYKLYASTQHADIAGVEMSLEELEALDILRSPPSTRRHKKKGNSKQDAQHGKSKNSYVKTRRGEDEDVEDNDAGDATIEDLTFATTPAPTPKPVTSRKRSKKTGVVTDPPEVEVKAKKVTTTPTIPMAAPDDDGNGWNPSEGEAPIGNDVTADELEGAKRFEHRASSKYHHLAHSEEQIMDDVFAVELALPKFQKRNKNHPVLKRAKRLAARDCLDQRRPCKPVADPLAEENFHRVFFGDVRTLDIHEQPSGTCYVYDIIWIPSKADLHHHYNGKTGARRLFWSQYTSYSQDAMQYCGEPPDSITSKWQERKVYRDAKKDSGNGES